MYFSQALSAMRHCPPILNPLSSLLLNRRKMVSDETCAASASLSGVRYFSFISIMALSLLFGISPYHSIVSNILQGFYVFAATCNVSLHITPFHSTCQEVSA